VRRFLAGLSGAPWDHRLFSLKRALRSFMHPDPRLPNNQCSVNLTTTDQLLRALVDRSVNNNFTPRVIGPQMVTWKSSPGDDNNSTTSTGEDGTSMGANSTASSSSFSSSSTTSSSSSESTAGSPASEDGHVTTFLAIGLALPGHPFSTDMYESLRIVGPMFPHLTIAVGNGYEFSSLCTQFGINSFPKLLYFEKGALAGQYGGSVEDAIFTPTALARSLINWHPSLRPRAMPEGSFIGSDVQHPLTLNRIERVLFPNASLAMAANSTSRSSGRNPGAFLMGPTMEPIAGSISALQPYEALLFAVCGLYSVARLACVVALMSPLKKTSVLVAVVIAAVIVLCMAHMPILVLHPTLPMITWARSGVIDGLYENL